MDWGFFIAGDLSGQERIIEITTFLGDSTELGMDLSRSERFEACVVKIVDDLERGLKTLTVRITQLPEFVVELRHKSEERGDVDIL